MKRRVAMTLQRLRGAGDGFSTPIGIYCRHGDRRNGFPLLASRAGKFMRILMWQSHGRYTQSLSFLQHDFFLPVSGGNMSIYGGRGSGYGLAGNVQDIPFDRVRDEDFDVVIVQSRQQWDVERNRLLSPDQLRIPVIYIEHDPPLESPAESVHPASGSDAVLVHVTEFNRLMWNAPGVRSTVIEHGVAVPGDIEYTGEIPRGIAAVNNVTTRGRRIGYDIIERVRERAPVDVVGMGAELAGGPGEVPPLELAAFEARYRFYLNPMRWTSLSMAACEAMLLGMPVLAPAVNEIVTVVRPGVEGYVETSMERLADHAARLIADPEEARELGRNARATAQERFGIDRFVADWDQLLRSVARPGSGQRAPALSGAAR